MIITDDALKPAFENLAEWKNKKGVQSQVYTVEYIDANYTDTGLPSKIRSFIKDMIPLGAVWVLLGGDTDIIPPSAVPASDIGGMHFFPTDLLYQDLDDTIDFLPEVYIGRAPVSTLTEANNLFKKYLLMKRIPQMIILLKSCFLLQSLTNGQMKRLPRI